MTATAPETTFIAEPGALDATTIAVIEAPREAVFRCFVEPELLVRWWAPSRFEVRIDRFVAAPGESWRLLNIDADGGTRLTEQALFQSVADRDGMADAGMRDFAPVGIAQLAEVARSL